ncbi:alpha-E domain-containing protein [Elongatibacter sediminis]|uniref:Alpha-E domain-containing protein n=1 Tax=Elongatibacter sediminis TaxID=3119006 RepID=A0AAW9RB21_9GAMM
MLSRVAERVYWMSRYLERVENTARLVAVYGELLLDLPDEAQLDWSVPLRILGMEDSYQSLGDGGDALEFLLSSDRNPAALKASLAHARENTRTTRDVVPSEAWRAINELYLHAAEHLSDRAQRPGSRIPGDIVRRCHEITGILEGTMSHGPAHRFVCLGRSLERADMTSRMIDVAAAILMTGREELRHHDNTVWRAVLRALSAYQMYRQYVRRRVEGADVVDFLLHDREFPRSVTFCVDVLDEAVAALPRGEAAGTRVKPVRDRLKGIDRDAIDHEVVHRFVDDLQVDLAALHGTIFETWLNPMRVV